MNPTLKRYLLSSLVTFLSTFSGVLALELNAGLPLEVTAPIVLALLGVAARAAIKAVVESFLPKQ